MRRTLSGLAKAVKDSADFAENFKELKKLPQNRHVGNKKFVTLCASIPGRAVPEMVGFALTAAPKLEGGESVEGSVLRWQMEAVSPSVQMEIQQY